MKLLPKALKRAGYDGADGKWQVAMGIIGKEVHVGYHLPTAARERERGHVLLEHVHTFHHPLQVLSGCLERNFKINIDYCQAQLQHNEE